MKLNKITFEDFRSVSSGSIDIEPNITTLVGINESGKSNVLVALEKAGRGHTLENHDITKSSKRLHIENSSPILTLEFSVEDSERNDLKAIFGYEPKDTLSTIVLRKESNKYTLKHPHIKFDKSNLAEKVPLGVDNSEVQKIQDRLIQVQEQIESKKVEITSSDDAGQKKKLQDQLQKLKENKVATEGTEKKVFEAFKTQQEEKESVRKTGIATLVVDEIVSKFIPKILFFDSVNIADFYLPSDGRVDIVKLITTPKKFKPIVNLLSLGGITSAELKNVLEAGDKEKNLRRKQRLNEASSKINSELFRKHWPLDKVEFELCVEETNNLLITFKEEGDDAPFVPGDRSRGLQWSVAFNIHFLAESKGGDLSDSILLIDEPGIFLHIDAQRRLLNQTFPEILIGNNQIIYTTHLPYLIDAKYPERIRILEKDSKSGETIIGNKAWSEGEVGDIPEPVKTALGTDWTYWLVSNDLSNCIVEGPSDQIILRMLGDKVESEFNFIPAYGNTRIPSALVLLKLDDKDAVAFTDNDLSEKEESVIETKLASMNINRAIISNISRLTENEDIVTIEDLVPEEIFHDAVYEVYQPLLKKFDADIKKDDIPVVYPRVKTFQEFFDSLSKKGNHAFKKMEVARAVSHIVKKIDQPASNNPKWTIVRKFMRNLQIHLDNKYLFQNNISNTKPIKDLNFKETIELVKRIKDKGRNKIS